MANTIPIPLNDIACQALILSRSVVHHGNLRKRGMLNNLAEKVKVKTLNLDQLIRWRQHYVVLIKGCIYVYNNEMSSKPTHATSLCEFNGVEACDHEVAFGISWPFKLVSANGNKEQCYYFSAPSERDLQVWIKSIKDQLLNLPRRVESQAIQTPITPYKAELRRAVGSNPPPLPPPRGSLPDGQYYSVCNDEQHENTDIPEEATGVPKVAVSLLRSTPRSRIANSFSVEGNCPPQAQSPTASSPPAVSYDNNISSQKKLPAIPPRKPFGSKGSSRSHSMADLSKTYEGSMLYPGTPYYLELDKQAQSKKSDIETEAFWNGRPEDADLIMTHVTHNGAYMLRESSEKGTRTLLVRVGPSVVKYKILIDTSGRQSLVADGPHFDTLTSLIIYYKSHSVPTRDVPLTLPYSVVENNFKR